MYYHHVTWEEVRKVQACESSSWGSNEMLSCLQPKCWHANSPIYFFAFLFKLKAHIFDIKEEAASICTEQSAQWVHRQFLVYIIVLSLYSIIKESGNKRDLCSWPKNHTTEKIIMGKILVTRIACLGLAAYIFRETIYRKKPRNLWGGETLIKIHLCWNEKCSSSMEMSAIIQRHKRAPQNFLRHSQV